MRPCQGREESGVDRPGHGQLRTLSMFVFRRASSALNRSSKVVPGYFCKKPWAKDGHFRAFHNPNILICHAIHIKISKLILMHAKTSLALPLLWKEVRAKGILGAIWSRNSSSISTEHDMRQVSEAEVEARLAFDNPWWSQGEGVEQEFQDFPKRAYLPPFFELVADRGVRRAVVLLGPRRVGKTVMVYQAVQMLLDAGVLNTSILYLSLETPVYTGLRLEKLISLFQGRFQHAKDSELFVFFDEVQYLRDWEIHLKSLVDSYRHVKFVVTGSAAAALRMKSRESGAGRFTEFMLPPLTFAEYLRFIGREAALVETEPLEGSYVAKDIDELNAEFINYLNFGGYPEAVMIPAVQADTARFIKADIVDKVLLRDLPSLYGIQDIQELNRLFMVVAYNTGDEVSLEGLAQSSGVAKNTLKRYLEYLEAAFLIRRIVRIDDTARRFKRATSFKVYLTNPSMRAALFGPVDGSDGGIMGGLTETAIFSQWIHHADFIDCLHYARWKDGEVDIVACDDKFQLPQWIVEVKWSDRFFDKPEELHALLNFLKKNRLRADDVPLVTTRTRRGMKIGVHKDVTFSINYVPSSVYCYTVGKRIKFSKP
jgi:uncharacterized protein